MKRILTILTVLTMTLGGCWGGGGGGGGTLRAESAPGTTETPVRLEPGLAALVYNHPDDTTAHFYFTDLNPDDLDPRNDLSPVSGTLIHVHMFVRPYPGRTPIDQTACTVVVRYVVISRGQIGVYGGGGFMFSSGKPGDRTLGGSIDGGSLRLMKKTDGFADRLGPAEISGRFTAELDPASAELLAQRLDQLIRAAGAEEKISPEQPAP